MYSSDGRVCIQCGWPVERCSCSKLAEEAVPATITARLSLEKHGRKGKTVTAVDGLPKNQDFLTGLVKELKKACGSGGAVGPGRVEIQGDQRERLRGLLEKKGWRVKG